MIILGSKIKKLRKQNNLTQKELASGICTQVTISKIENYNNIPNMVILSKLCTRLKINIEDVCIAESESNENYDKSIDLEDYCNKFEYKKAYNYIINEFKESDMTHSGDKNMYDYYMGSLLLEYKKDVAESMYYLNMVLVDSENTFLNVLALNRIGVAYDMDGKFEKAKKYYDMSIDKLKDIDSIDCRYLDKVLLVYYNCAAYYSKTNNFKKAVELTNLGIEVAKEESFYSHLDKLYYENAYSLIRLNQVEEARKSYFMALSLGELSDNKLLLETAHRDMAEYNIE